MIKLLTLEIFILFSKIEFQLSGSGSDKCDVLAARGNWFSLARAGYDEGGGENGPDVKHVIVTNGRLMAHGPPVRIVMLFYLCFIIFCQ